MFHSFHKHQPRKYKQVVEVIHHAFFKAPVQFQQFTQPYRYAIVAEQAHEVHEKSVAGVWLWGVGHFGFLFFDLTDLTDWTDQIEKTDRSNPSNPSDC